jgi:hypothetical protein
MVVLKEDISDSGSLKDGGPIRLREKAPAVTVASRRDTDNLWDV